MKEIKLKLYEIIGAEVEVNGLKNPQTGEQLAIGILSLKISLVAKYWITEISNTLVAQKRIIESLRDELIKQFGEPSENGAYTIKTYEDDSAEEKVFNPKYVEFNEKYTELLNEERTLQYNPVKLSLFEKVDSLDNYPHFFKFVDPKT